MSLQWIKLYANLPDHPKCDALEVELGVPRAWTHLVELWLWAAKVKADGNLTGVSSAIIAKRAGWTGDANLFVDALRATGWLDPDGRLHGWDEHQGAHREKIERDRERQRERREGVARPSRDGHATVAGEKRREEKRREEIQESESAAAAPLAPGPGLAQAPSEPPEPSPADAEDRADRREGRAVVREARRERGERRAASEAIWGRPGDVIDLLELRVVTDAHGRLVVAPDDAADVSERFVDVLARECPCLDGKGKPRRPAVADAAGTLWPRSQDRAWGTDGSAYLSWWRQRMSDIAEQKRRAWEADGGTVQTDQARIEAKRRWLELKSLRGTDLAPFETWFVEVWPRVKAGGDDGDDGAPRLREREPEHRRFEAEPVYPVAAADSGPALLFARGPTPTTTQTPTKVRDLSQARALLGGRA